MKANRTEVSAGLIDRQGTAPQNEIGSMTGSESESHMSTRMADRPLRTTFAVYFNYIYILNHRNKIKSSYQMETSLFHEAQLIESSPLLLIFSKLRSR